jgi:hypothetical protein
MNKDGSILNILDKSLRLGGAVFEKCFNLTIDGFQDLIFSVIDYGADLSKVERSKIIDFLQILNTRRTLACAIYPIEEIEKRLKDDPENYQYKIDYVEQLERQSILVMKLMEWMAFTPIEKKAVKRMFKNVQEIRDEVGLSQLHYDEIKFILANLTVEMNEALDESNEEVFKPILVQLIRCKILLGNYSDIDHYFDLLKMFNLDQYNLLKGKYLFRNEDFETSYNYLNRAYDKEVEYSKDLLAQCLDELVKTHDNKEKWISEKREKFGSLFSSENKETIKSLPHTFLQLKWKEVHKVFNNMKKTQENKSA